MMRRRRRPRWAVLLWVLRAITVPAAAVPEAAAAVAAATTPPAAAVRIPLWNDFHANISSGENGFQFGKILKNLDDYGRGRRQNGKERVHYNLDESTMTRECRGRSSCLVSRSSAIAVSAQPPERALPQLSATRSSRRAHV